MKVKRASLQDWLFRASIVAATLGISAVVWTRMQQADFESKARSFALGIEAGDVADTDLVIAVFGDYQCPPCRSGHNRLAVLRTKSSVKSKVVYRHLPLTAIHPYAWDMAVHAELARRQGRLDQAHQIIYQSAELPDYPAVISRLKRLLGPTSASAQAAAESKVKQDVLDSQSLGVQATPTYFVVRGTKVQYMSLAQIEDLLAPPSREAGP